MLGFGGDIGGYCAGGEEVSKVAETKWEPIETAPRDGTNIITRCFRRLGGCIVRLSLLIGLRRGSEI